MKSLAKALLIALFSLTTLVAAQTKPEVKTRFIVDKPTVIFCGAAPQEDNADAYAAWVDFTSSMKQTRPKLIEMGVSVGYTPAARIELVEGYKSRAVDINYKLSYAYVLARPGAKEMVIYGVRDAAAVIEAAQKMLTEANAAKIKRIEIKQPTVIMVGPELKEDDPNFGAWDDYVYYLSLAAPLLKQQGVAVEWSPGYEMDLAIDGKTQRFAVNHEKLLFTYVFIAPERAAKQFDIELSDELLDAAQKFFALKVSAEQLQAKDASAAARRLLRDFAHGDWAAAEKHGATYLLTDEKKKYYGGLKALRIGAPIKKEEEGFDGYTVKARLRFANGVVGEYELEIARDPKAAESNAAAWIVVGGL